MKRSNIDAMICKQEGITEITRDEIHRIQLEKLNIVLKREKEREGFYRDLPERLESLIDLRSLPFTTETDLARDGGRMLLCSQGEVQKVISEQTSGTTGAGKRVFYTEGDCEHTIVTFYGNDWANSDRSGYTNIAGSITDLLSKSQYSGGRRSAFTGGSGVSGFCKKSRSGSGLQTSERTKRELFLSKEHCGNQCKGI